MTDDRMEQYLRDTLGAKDKQAFEKELESSPALKLQLEQKRRQLTEIKGHFLKEDLKNLRSVTDEKNTSKKKWLWAILGLLLLSFTIVYLWPKQQLDTPELIYMAYYAPDPGLPTPMGVSENHAFLSAMVEYKSANYDNALTMLTQLNSAQPANDTINYYLANTHQALENYAEAKRYYMDVIEANSNFSNKSKFQLGLLYLLSGNLEESKQWIQSSGRQIEELAEPME